MYDYAFDVTFISYYFIHLKANHVCVTSNYRFKKNISGEVLISAEISSVSHIKHDRTLKGLSTLSRQTIKQLMQQQFFCHLQLKQAQARTHIHYHYAVYFHSFHD